MFVVNLSVLLLWLIISCQCHCQLFPPGFTSGTVYNSHGQVDGRMDMVMDGMIESWT